MIYLLDFRGADVGGPVVPGRILRMSGLPGPQGNEDDLVLEPTITFLLHGFNVDRQYGQDSLFRLAARLSRTIAGALVMVLWPGDHWARAISYPFEGNDADDTAAELARFIERVVQPSTKLSFVSHSLGARVVMETLKRLGGFYPVGQVCLMAPAIDDCSLSDPEAYASLVDATARVAVLASHRDSVLRLAYPIGDLLQAFFFFGKDSSSLALGYHGPKAVEGQSIPAGVYHVQIPDERNSDHSDCIPAEAPSPNQLSAVAFAQEVLQRALMPQYP